MSLLDERVRGFEEGIEHRSTRREIQLSSGGSGILELSNAGRTLEFYGTNGTYWASIVDDTKGNVFLPLRFERVGSHTGNQVVYNERTLQVGEDFSASPPYTREVVGRYLEISKELFEELL